MRTKSGGPGSFWAFVEAFEATLIQHALDKFDGNVSAAARFLKLDRITLIRKSDRYGLRRRRLRQRKPTQSRRAVSRKGASDGARVDV